MRTRLWLLTVVSMLLFSALPAQIFFTANLDGSQENPAVTTTATGTGTFVLNADATELSYSITINGLTPTAAHFHNAPAGTNGNVVKNLSFINNHATGVWKSSDASQPFTDSLLSELLSGRLYVNVHTSANPGGEIRGQVMLSNPVGFTAMLTGSQENPPVTTSAGGTGVVILVPGGSVVYDLTVTGLTPTASHFHNAPAGTNGGVVKNISLINNTAAGTWSSSDGTQPLTNLLLRELVRGRLYMNVHTAANPGGEIRGQVLLNRGITLLAKLDGSQENPPVTTTAVGTGAIVLNSSGTSVSYHITINGLTPTAAHFHNAPEGTNGNVVKNLSFTNNVASGVWTASDGSQPLTDSLLSELLRGQLYVNVHTSNNPGGEIRGQVFSLTGSGFAVNLDGSQENPPLTTTAVGTASVRLEPDGTVSYDLTVTGLTPTASHFHNAPAGTNGGVVKNISLVDNTASGTWSSSDGTQPLTTFLLRELVKGRLYINVHTAANPGGEIRGQVLPATGLDYVTGVRPAESAVASQFELAQNYPNPFNPATTIRYSIPEGITRSARVTLRIFNILGQEVAVLVNGEATPGTYEVTWHAGGLPSGIYFYRLSVSPMQGLPTSRNGQAGVEIQTRKLLLLK
jgi:hypothetical protein